MARAARDELTDTAADAAIDQACRILRLPTIRDRHGEVAAAASRQQASYKGFLVELLSIECDDREQRRKARLVREAGFPRPKRIEDFDYAANPNVPAALIRTLAAGTPYLKVFQIAGATAFIGYWLALCQQSIWYRRSWKLTLKAAFDGLIYASLTAGAFGWLWPR